MAPLQSDSPSNWYLTAGLCWLVDGGETYNNARITKIIKISVFHCVHFRMSHFGVNFLCKLQFNLIFTNIILL